MTDNEPDLRIHFFRLWIHELAHPSSRAREDRGWLLVSAQCSAPGAMVMARGEFLSLSDLDRWYDELHIMDRTLHGEACLKPLDPDLLIEMKCTPTGIIETSIQITPDYTTQLHSFHLTIDQSYLKGLLEQLRKINLRFHNVEAN